MSTLTPRERTLIGAGIVVALAIGVPGLLSPSAPAGRTLASAKQERREVQAELGRVRREIEALQAGVEGRISTGDSQALVGRMVQASEGAARAAGLRVTDLKPAAPEKVSGLQRVAVQMTLTASFAQSVRFLYELERSGRASTERFQVDDLQMAATDPRKDLLALELRVVGFVKVEETEDGSGT